MKVMKKSVISVFINNKENEVFQFSQDRKDVIEQENDLSGYFCIITSEPMTAIDALLLYKSRDSSEKLFRGDKSIRVYGDAAADAKIFIEFIALIIRNRIYNCLKDEWIKLKKRPNDMTVPAVTATQKTILKAFGMDANFIKYYAAEIGEILREAK